MSDCNSITKIKKLSAGSKIGLISLSSALAPGSLDASLEFIKNKGFELVMPLDPYEFYQRNDHLFACNSIEKRVAALNSLLADPEIGAILNVRGGYGSIELLPHLDYSLFKKFPKLIVGFSDPTAIINAIYSQSNLVTIHGPTARSFSDISFDEDAERSTRMLFKFLTGKTLNPFEEIDLVHVTGSKEPVSGALVGGNLIILAAICGTKWIPDLKGKILFIEETKENPYRVHRALTQLKLAGKFDELAAVLLGDFRTCTHPYDLGPNIDEVLKRFFADLNIPVYKGLPAGHIGLNYPIPIGIQVEISNCEINLLESVFN